MLSCPFCKAEIVPPAASSDADFIYACSACLNPVGMRGSRATAGVFALAGEPDVRAVASEKSLGGSILRRLRESTTDLPVLPEVSRRVMAVINDDKASMNDLARIVREDSAMAANVLRVANSAAYGGLHTVSELGTACARLGLKTVANTVQLVVSKKVFESNDPVVSSMMDKLWRHSVAVAHFASGVGTALSMPRTDALYLQGLFHDIGKLAILTVCRGTDTKSSSNGHLTDDVLIEVIEAYHRLAGLHMLIRWNLPPEFLTTVYYHDDPDAAPADTDRRAMHVVSLANRLAYASGLGFGTEPQEDSLMDHPSTAYLQLNDIKLASIRVDLEEKLESVLGVVA